MNERIQELLKKAQNIAAKNHTPGGRAYEREIYVKFAELIVKECADVMINDPRLSDVRSATRGCARSIKEHFGVGE